MILDALNNTDMVECLASKHIIYSVCSEILFRFINRNSTLIQNFSLKKTTFLKKELYDVVDYNIGIKMFITLLKKCLNFI